MMLVGKGQPRLVLKVQAACRPSTGDQKAAWPPAECAYEQSHVPTSAPGGVARVEHASSDPGAVGSPVAMLSAPLCQLRDLPGLPQLRVHVKPARRVRGEERGGHRVQAYRGEGVLPVDDAQVHHHEPQVVHEGRRDQVPVEGQILEPDGGLGAVTREHKECAAVLHRVVQAEGRRAVPVLRVARCLGDLRWIHVLLAQLVQAVHRQAPHGCAGPGRRPGPVQAVALLVQGPEVPGQPVGRVSLLPATEGRWVNAGGVAPVERGGA
eukprot:CAMPEP_0206017938 /NCGR_PEP_ID=MMETSP1464-20131121/26060_1 /ASSEMBLY_ACC=CAM_ASM_001124 /TAXON_ID=119497 /ORGANISM="Exanthemachrysis gayraliae, Strain RCC1523" /LENGTH=265 /DNA_ID=CAMNT_0053391795 /DNA_START=180 /DNA_END=974 /DNA_ORIENTATION=+